MSLLLPQTRAGRVLHAQPVDIHGDRYVDVQVALDDDPEAAPRVGRISASECPGDLGPGDRVEIRFVMGVMTKIIREPAAS